jgi:hypothetical protein
VKRYLPVRLLFIRYYVILTIILAGGDLKEMNDTSFIEVYQNGFLSSWDDILKIRKPIIAAVNGLVVSYT